MLPDVILRRVAPAARQVPRTVTLPLIAIVNELPENPRLDEFRVADARLRHATAIVLR